MGWQALDYSFHPHLISRTQMRGHAGRGGLSNSGRPLVSLQRMMKNKSVHSIIYISWEETLLSTKILEADRKKYCEVIGKFDMFYQVRKNVIFERARFNQRCQEPEESVEQFITSLYDLAENYSYDDLKDQMIRDSIVVGIRDRSLSECLQLDPELTLEKAKTLVRQHEVYSAGTPGNTQRST